MKVAKGIFENVVRAILIVALTAGTAPLVGAQSAKAKTSGAAAAAPPRTSAKPSGGRQEGIKVHGHWVIEVRNPDGSMATRREFENALLQRGMTGLVSVLSRNSSVGRWDIYFGPDLVGDPSPCGGAANLCVISEGTPAVLFGNSIIVGTNLQLITLPATGFPTMLQLKGSGAVTTNGIIGFVRTAFGQCSSTTAPASPCGMVQGTAFTFTQADSTSSFQPISVVSGQIVQITVTFSFS